MSAWFAKKKKKKAAKAAVKTTSAAASTANPPVAKAAAGATAATATDPGKETSPTAPDTSGAQPLLSPEVEAALIKLAAALTEESESEDEAKDEPQTSQSGVRSHEDSTRVAVASATQAAMAQAAIVQAAAASAAQTALLMTHGPGQPPYAQSAPPPQPIYILMPTGPMAPTQALPAQFAQPMFFAQPQTPEGQGQAAPITPGPVTQPYIQQPVPPGEDESSEMSESEQGLDSIPPTLDGYVPEDTDLINDGLEGHQEAGTTEEEGTEPVDEDEEEIERTPEVDDSLLVPLHSADDPGEKGEKSVLKDSVGLLKSAGSKAALVGKEVGGKAYEVGKDVGGKAYVVGKDAGLKATSKSKAVGGKTASTTTDKSKGMGSKILDKTKQVGGKTIKATKDVGGKALDKTKQVGGKTLDKTKEISGKTTGSAKKTASKGKKSE